MITGNFAVDVCGVHTRVDYTVEPEQGTFNQYHFIVYPNAVTIDGNAKPDVPDVMLAGLSNLVFARVQEQISLTPRYIGINVD